VGAAFGGDHLGRASHFTGNPADRGDQLGNGVLSGDRIVDPTWLTFGRSGVEVVLG
jgi:hypothetical protein